MENLNIQSIEKWRPSIHFSPKKNWMNDPNGLFYLNGFYHLYFQYNPTGNQWGNMHWGHARSSDLKSWEELPVAIHAQPDGLGYIYSGCIVVDHNNTSGFGDGINIPVVALFTQCSKENHQVQSVAYSLDEGITWIHHDNNPVIENKNIQDFRDPKVFWYAPENKWVMALTIGINIRFYESSNLREWSFLSDFTVDNGIKTLEWECPDLFTLKSSCGNNKWVLIVSIKPGGPSGGSGAQYFIGNFDGRKFTAEHDIVRWLDYGPDNYASVSWNNLDQNRKLILGWMSNWDYASAIPTDYWRGMMTIPRDLSLIEYNGSYLLTQSIAREVKEQFIWSKSTNVLGNDVITLPPHEQLYIKFESQKANSDSITYELSNAFGEKLSIIYEPSERRLKLDRKSVFSQIDTLPFRPIEAEVFIESGIISGEVLIDKSSVEIFAQGGTTILTAAIYPNSAFNQLRVIGNQQNINNLRIYTLEEI